MKSNGFFTFHYSLFIVFSGVWFSTEVETELADTFIYQVRLADTPEVDLLAAAERKIEVNERKYPVEKVKGSARKYTEYG